MDLTVIVHRGADMDGSQLHLTWAALGRTGSLHVEQMCGFIESYEFADEEAVTADDLILG